MKTIKLFLILFTMICLSCKKEEDPQFSTLALSFDHVVEGNPLQLDTIIYVNAAGNKYSVQTLKYYISNIRLKKETGQDFLIDTLLYCDVLLPNTLQHQLKNVPKANYKSISFTFGLDSTKNKSLSISNTSENRAMEWPEPMGGGYHYMKFEGKILIANDSFAHFNTHTGRVKDRKGKLFNNDFTVSLGFDPVDFKNSGAKLEIRMDLNEWYKTPYVYDLMGHLKIMDNQEAQDMLKSNGKDAFSIVNISNK